MKASFPLFISILTISTLAFLPSLAAQTKADPAKEKPAAKAEPKKTEPKKPAKSGKKTLTDAEKKELKEATEALKVMRTYHKSRFTKLFNSGSKEELMELPDVGEKTAQRIIEGRPYDTSAHVVLVKGIGVEMYKKFVDAKK